MAKELAGSRPVASVNWIVVRVQGGPRRGAALYSLSLSLNRIGGGPEGRSPAGFILIFCSDKSSRRERFAWWSCWHCTLRPWRSVEARILWGEGRLRLQDHRLRKKETESMISRLKAYSVEYAGWDKGREACVKREQGKVGQTTIRCQHWESKEEQGWPWERCVRIGIGA